MRDFNDTHPDFEPRSGIGGLDSEDAGPGVRPFARDALDPGIVEPDLGPDGKPVYAGNPITPSTSGKADFDEWYRDPPAIPAGINLKTEVPLALLASPTDPTQYVYLNDQMFPIDDQLLGNEGRLHNYDFTVEAETTFRYGGGETLSFTSDDDLWVFVNRKLAVDLGGTHSPIAGSVDLDAASSSLGIVKGNTYSMHLFFAERHIVQSVLHIIVPAADFGVCN